MANKERLVLVAMIALVALRAVALGALVQHLPADVGGHFIASDALRYTEIAHTPGTPYRDHLVEVPPVEVGLLEVVAVEDPRETAIRNAWVQLILDLVVAGALILGWGRITSLWYLTLGLPLAPFLYFRLDLLSVALAVLGIALVRRERPVSGGLLLGVAVYAKFWPIALLTLLIARRRWRALAATAVVVLIGAAAWVAWVGPQGPQQVATFRNATGWQIESIIGSIILVSTALPVLFEAGANRIGSVPLLAKPASSVAIASGLAFLTWCGWRSSHPADEPHVRDQDGLLALASVGLLLILAPILSWQYIAWLLPWMAVIAAEHRRILTALSIGVIATTCALLSMGVALTAREPAAIIVLLARNALLVGLVAATFSSAANRRQFVGADAPTAN